MNCAICLVILSVVGATIAAVTGKAADLKCPCSPEEKQEDHNSKLRIAWLVLQDYKTKLEINKLEKELGMNETAFRYEALTPEDISVLTTANLPDCVCGPNVEREKKNTYLRTAYLTLFSYKAELEIIKIQKEMGLPQTNFDLDKIVWPENVITSTETSIKVRRAATCSNGCILYCIQHGGVKYNKDGSCTTGYTCQCNKPRPSWP